MLQYVIGMLSMAQVALCRPVCPFVFRGFAPCEAACGYSPRKRRERQGVVV